MKNYSLLLLLLRKISSFFRVLFIKRILKEYPTIKMVFADRKSIEAFLLSNRNIANDICVCATYYYQIGTTSTVYQTSCDCNIVACRRIVKNEKKLCIFR